MEAGISMTIRMSLEDMKEQGAGHPAPDDVIRLYQTAFRDYGTRALWSRKPLDTPTIRQAINVAQSLRKEGDMRARSLALEIENACRAAL
jgi:hypothetical protein